MPESAVEAASPFLPPCPLVSLFITSESHSLYQRSYPDTLSLATAYSESVERENINSWTDHIYPDLLGAAYTIFDLFGPRRSLLKTHTLALVVSRITSKDASLQFRLDDVVLARDDDVDRAMAEKGYRAVPSMGMVGFTSVVREWRGQGCSMGTPYAHGHSHVRQFFPKVIPPFGFGASL